MEQLNVLLRIFFVSGVFQKIYVDFWHLLKAEKVHAPKQFWQEKKFSQNFFFYHPYEYINFQPAGFLAFKEKSGPLLHPYFYEERVRGFLTFRFSDLMTTLTYVLMDNSCPCFLIKLNKYNRSFLNLN